MENTSASEWSVRKDDRTGREFVIHHWEPYLLFEVVEESHGWSLEGIDQKVSSDDMNPLTIARLSREAGEFYRKHVDRVR